MREDTVFFGTPPFLVGVMTVPEAVEHDSLCPAIIMLNAGRVHHVGPSRLYVKIARRLAAAGFMVLRFDFSGIGDSSTRHDHLPFDKSVIQETQDAMHYMSEVHGKTRFILLGLCSGANSALVTASCDPRVVGVVLINVQPVPSEELRATLLDREFTRYFWRIFCHPRLWLRVLHQEWEDRFWRVWKIISIQLTKVCMWRNTRAHNALEKAAASVSAPLRILIERNTCMLVIYSEDDLGLDYLQMLSGSGIPQLKSNYNVDIKIISRSDHTFTTIQNQESLIEIIFNWSMINFKNNNKYLTQYEESFKKL
jgi:pimeloyl-ACP methyl ester carboxylesterase